MVKNLNSTVKNYVRGSLQTYIDGGKYTKDKKPKSLNWIMGEIRNSGIKLELLKIVFDEIKNYPRTVEDKNRLDLVLKECQKNNLL